MADPQRRRLFRGGWIPDLPDQRDQLYAAPMIARLPPSVDLRPQCAPVYDQGDLGSCTANALAGAVEFDEDKERLTSHGTPSRLFIYYNERVIEHTVGEDSGAMLRDGIKTLAKQGAPQEAVWPYDVSQFAVKPPATAYTAAKSHTITSYARILRLLSQFKGCLASGFPFVFGFSVYESMESDQVARTGVVPMPESDEQLLGGHAVLAVGYDDSTRRFLVRNSWGSEWGMAGYFTLPFAYLLTRSLSSDFWVVRATR